MKHFTLCVLILLVTCRMADGVEPVFPTNLKGGVIVDNRMHVLLYVPPFLLGYAIEGDSQDYIFQSPFVSTDFDYDVAGGQLFLIGEVESLPPIDGRPSILFFSSVKALETVFTSVKAPKGRTYNGMRMIHRLDPNMLHRERIGASDVFASSSCAPTIFVKNDGTILGGASNGALTRYFSREPILFGSVVNSKTPSGVYKIVSDHEIQSKPVGLLSMGGRDNGYIISHGSFTKAVMPEVSLVIPEGFSVVIDKDKTRFIAMGAKIEDDRMGMLTADDNVIMRRTVLYSRLSKSLASAREKLGVKDP